MHINLTENHFYSLFIYLNPFTSQCHLQGHNKLTFYFSFAVLCYKIWLLTIINVSVHFSISKGLPLPPPHPFPNIAPKRSISDTVPRSIFLSNFWGDSAMADSSETDTSKKLLLFKYAKNPSRKKTFLHLISLSIMKNR